MVILLVSSCSNTQSPQSQNQSQNTSQDAAFDDTFVEGSIGDASYLNPVLASDNASSTINGLVFNGLVKYDENLKLVGDLAKDWTVSDNGLIITFHLKDNVRWHDGKKFTAEDVQYTFERLRDPQVKTPFGSNYDTVKSLEILNPTTIRVTYKERFVPALESWSMGILPKHVFEGATGLEFNQHPANKKPIGTGPYKFISWRTDEKIVLESNPDYFDKKIHIKRYIFRIIPDDSVQFLELRNKSIDTMTLTPDQYRAYDEFFQQYHKYRFPRASYTFFAFNLKNTLFKNKETREALATAIDKKTLVQGVLNGLGKSATGPYLPGSWAFNENVKDFEYNPERARSILESQGWRDHDGDGWLDKNGQKFEFTVITNQGNKMRSLTAEILQQQFRLIGVQMKIRIIEWSTFIKEFVDKQNFDALILGWTLTPDPDNFGIWHSSQRKPGQYNFVSYENKDVDRLLELGRKEFDFKKREKIYKQIHQIIFSDVPYIFLYVPDFLPVVHSRFEGPRIVPLSSFGFGWNFDDWFVTKNNVKYPVLSEK